MLKIRYKFKVEGNAFNRPLVCQRVENTTFLTGADFFYYARASEVSDISESICVLFSKSGYVLGTSGGWLRHVKSPAVRSIRIFNFIHFLWPFLV